MSSSEHSFSKVSECKVEQEVPKIKDTWNYQRTEKLVIVGDPNDRHSTDTVVVDHRKRTYTETIYLRPSPQDRHYRPQEHLLQENKFGLDREGPLKRYRAVRDFRRRVGDIPCEHNTFWEIWEKDHQGLDKLEGLPFTQHLENAAIHNWPEDYEEIPREELSLVEIRLSPEQSYRELGHVYFDKVIAYLPSTTTRVPKLKLPPVRHYQYIGDPEDNIWEEVDINKYQRKPRADKYKPQEGNGILKHLTVAGQRDEFWKERLAYITSVQEEPQYPSQHQEIIKNIFSDLVENQSNLQHWFDTTTSLLQSDKDIHREWSRKYRYYMNRKYRNKLADLCDNRHHAVEKLRRILRRALSAKVLRGYGTDYEFIPKTYETKTLTYGKHYLSPLPTRAKDTCEPTILPTVVPSAIEI
jgi:hypothetical protein